MRLTSNDINTLAHNGHVHIGDDGVIVIESVYGNLRITQTPAGLVLDLEPAVNVNTSFFKKFGTLKRRLGESQAGGQVFLVPVPITYS